MVSMAENDYRRGEARVTRGEVRGVTGQRVARLGSTSAPPSHCSRRSTRHNAREEPAASCTTRTRTYLSPPDPLSRPRAVARAGQPSEPGSPASQSPAAHPAASSPSPAPLAPVRTAQHSMEAGLTAAAGLWATRSGREAGGQGRRPRGHAGRTRRRHPNLAHDAQRRRPDRPRVAQSEQYGVHAWGPNSGMRHAAGVGRLGEGSVLGTGRGHRVPRATASGQPTGRGRSQHQTQSS